MTNKLPALPLTLLITMSITLHAAEPSAGPVVRSDTQLKQQQSPASRATRSGQEVADALNARYFDTRATCEGGKPSYYCNGVTLRGTELGSWDPWDPSDGAIRKGSQSFSYIRTDAKAPRLWRTSGYVLLPQAEALSQGKPVEYLCAYPHDAYTDLVGRPAFGCGLQTKSNEQLIRALDANPDLVQWLRDNPAIVERLRNIQDSATLRKYDPRLAERLKATPNLGRLLLENSKRLEEWTHSENLKVHPSRKLADPSTCSGKNAITPPTWNTYTSRLTNRAYQCSLSTENASQFDTNVKARAYAMPAAIHSDWNELLIKVWPAGSVTQLPLEAFYYQGRESPALEDAQMYQAKYRRATGGQWLPILMINPTAGMGKAFFYFPEDQAIEP